MNAAQQAIKTPPSPKGHWLFGHGQEVSENPLKFYVKYQKEFGDVVKFKTVFGFSWYLVTDPTGIERVLQANQANYRKAPIMTSALSLVIGNGLVISEGDFWRRQRRLMQPAFHRQRLALLAETMQDSAAGTAERWEASFIKNGEPFEVTREMTDLTIKIAARTLFGADVSADSARFADALQTALAHVNFKMMYPFAVLDYVPTGRNRRFKEAMKTLDEVVRKIIAERRHSQADKGDLLSMLMLARDEETGEAMTDAQLRDEVLTLLIAGHETTASALSWMWLLLAKNKESFGILRAELDEVLAGKPVTLDALPRLPYTRAVFDETQRLYPPAWGIPRQAVAADEIGGYRIEAGKMVVVSQYIAHRHPAFWENPEKFEPARFLPENSNNRPLFAYFPFGGGARKCIGNHFALMEAQIITATIAQKFAPEFADDDPDVDPTFALRPKNGLRLRFVE
jgi:cytochrome P450